MTYLNNLDEYLEIKQRMKKERKRFTNDMLSDEDVKKFIAAGRVQYLECEAGVTFFIDHKTYDKAVLFIDPGKNWQLDVRDKPVLIQTRYQRDRKKKDLIQLEQQMKQNDFSYQYTIRSIRLDAEERREYYEKQYQRAQKLLERMDYRIKKADYHYHGQIQELIKQQDVGRYFEYPYKTEEEIKEEYAKGNHTCIVNSDDEVLAFCSGFEMNGCWYAAGLGVREEYKMCGLAPIFLYDRVHNKEPYVMIAGVLTDNTDAIKFQKSMGWIFTNRYTDFWLRS